MSENVIETLLHPSASPKCARFRLRHHCLLCVFLKAVKAGFHASLSAPGPLISPSNMSTFRTNYWKYKIYLRINTQLYIYNTVKIKLQVFFSPKNDLFHHFGGKLQKMISELQKKKGKLQPAKNKLQLT